METVSLAALPDDRRAVVFEDAPRVVRLRLAADDAIPAHRHPDHTVTVHVVDGAVTVTVGDDTAALGAGELVRFSGDHDVAIHADDASELLVTLAA